MSDPFGPTDSDRYQQAREQIDAINNLAKTIAAAAVIQAEISRQNNEPTIPRKQLFSKDAIEHAANVVDDQLLG